MCGIVGFLTNRSLNNSKIIESMSNSIIHRGPDNFGYYENLDYGIYLGFRRLSIIDLSNNGSQPIESYDKRYVMVFNGEIYNYKKIRELINIKSQNSVFFKSSSDSEVLVNSFAIFGINETLKILHGQFALCLWDNKLKKFFLIRDRFGEKPMYYGFIEDSFVFASELKAINKFPNFNKKISKKSLSLYLKYLCVPDHNSIYEDIFKILPSEILEIDISKSMKINKNLKIKKNKYWNIYDESKKTVNQKKIDENMYLRKTEDALRASIEEQSFADVAIGSFLSGGIDSSLITSLYQTQSQNKINTFTVGFENKNFDESSYADLISKKLNTNHTKILLKESESINIVENLSEIYCEPFADSSQIPTYLLCREVKKYTTVALSGDGGDELFGGYNRYIWSKKIWFIISFFPKKIRIFLSSLIYKISEDKFDLLFVILKKITFNILNVSFAGQKLHRLAYRLRYTNSIEELYDFMITEWIDDENILNGKDNQIFKIDYEKLDFLNTFEDQMMIKDTVNYLPNDILVKTDRASMYNSLELRSPFLNQDIFSISRQIPLNLKINSNSGKIILKKILNKYISRELIDRPKQGFAVPVDIWLNSSLKDWAENLLSVHSCKKHDFFNFKIINKKWNEHKNNKRNWGQSLWVILMFQQWYQHYK